VVPARDNEQSDLQISLLGFCFEKRAKGKGEGEKNSLLWRQLVVTQTNPGFSEDHA
jgi:hypothetical protein